MESGVDMVQPKVGDPSSNHVVCQTLSVRGVWNLERR